ncbi:MAG: SDR family oxidoreductase [Clostridia bacterium]|nr:SDR family oxidoreductase [Clostridia bacterium]MBO4884394.1 SDR family oxidoreductase [Clostridia bacterium]MBR4443951.1 SDR family oxidoreductase [Clostridia bacterium]
MDRKIALVTGAGRGIGKGIAIRLAGAGYDVGVHYGASADGARDTARQCRALGARAEVFQADIRHVDEIHAMFGAFFQTFDHLDLMVNNAGVTRFQPFLEATEEMFDTVIGTDLRGTYFCAQAAARSMVEKGVKGVIINISSNHAQGCWPTASFYAAAKAGVDKLGRNIAMELAPYGIRVVTIAPGYTHIPENDRPGAGGRPAWIDAISRRIPIGRIAEPEEIGDAVVFLASDGAGCITGTTLSVDGGALLPVVTENRFGTN